MLELRLLSDDAAKRVLSSDAIPTSWESDWLAAEKAESRNDDHLHVCSVYGCATRIAPDVHANRYAGSRAYMARSTQFAEGGGAIVLLVTDDCHGWDAGDVDLCGQDDAARVIQFCWKLRPGSPSETDCFKDPAGRNWLSKEQLRRRETRS
jgi:hypothetical protein